MRVPFLHRSHVGKHRVTTVHSQLRPARGVTISALRREDHRLGL